MPMVGSILSKKKKVGKFLPLIVIIGNCSELVRWIGG